MIFWTDGGNGEETRLMVESCWRQTSIHLRAQPPATNTRATSRPAPWLIYCCFWVEESKPLSAINISSQITYSAQPLAIYLSSHPTVLSSRISIFWILGHKMLHLCFNQKTPESYGNVLFGVVCCAVGSCSWLDIKAMQEASLIYSFFGQEWHL